MFTYNEDMKGNANVEIRVVWGGGHQRSLAMAPKKIKKQRQTTQTTKQQIISSQFWSHVCKFLALNRAVIYLMQDFCTRKNLYKKA